MRMSAADDFSDFFLLNDPFLKTVFRGDSQDYAVLRNKTFGDTSIVSVPRITLEEGYPNKPTNVIWISLIPIVDEVFLSALSECEASGFDSFEVSVFNRHGNRIEGYRGLAVTGRCGTLGYNPKTAEVVQVKRPARTVPHYRGMRLLKPDDNVPLSAE